MNYWRRAVNNVMENARNGMLQFVRDLFHQAEDLSLLTQRIIRGKYQERLGGVELDSDQKSLLKIVVLEVLQEWEQKKVDASSPTVGQEKSHEVVECEEDENSEDDENDDNEDVVSEQSVQLDSDVSESENNVPSRGRSPVQNEDSESDHGSDERLYMHLPDPPGVSNGDQSGSDDENHKPNSHNQEPFLEDKQIKVKHKSVKRTRSWSNIDSEDDNSFTANIPASPDVNFQIEDSPVVKSNKHKKRRVNIESSESDLSEPEGGPLKLKITISPMKQKSDITNRTSSTSTEGSRQKTKKNCKKQKTVGRPRSSQKQAVPVDATKTERVKFLEKLCRMIPGVMPVGLRYREVFGNCTTESDRVSKLEELLQEAGMEGKPTKGKAAAIKLKQEAAELDTGNIIKSTGRSKRNAGLFLTKSAVERGPAMSTIASKAAFSRLEGILDSEGSESDS